MKLRDLSIILFLALLVLSFPLKVMAGPLTVDEIKKHYRGIHQIQGEAEQIKTSPLLLRPLKSNVSLHFDEGILTWQVEGQEPWQIKFGGDGKPVFINGGKYLAQIPSDAREKLDRTVGLVHNILTMDPKLDDDFHLTLDKEFLTIVPKSEKSGVFFKSIAIQFNRNADIQNIRFNTEEDETKLVFKSITLKR
ncbi:MAG: hypothetical protein H7249_05510 [Chitinophagaceae bacterium]|nr:hypothetical protein [Oligoflexus sp.]